MSGREVRAGSAFVELGIKNRIKSGLQQAQKDLSKFGQDTMRLGSVIAAASGGLLAFPIQAASRMQETMGKFSVVFGQSAGEVEKWSDTTAFAMGVSEEAMASMLASMQDLLVPMGVLPDQATEMSKTLSTLAVDLGSFNNMNTADVFRDLMAAITGEGQVMKKYGVILTEAATKQELLNMGLDPKTADDNAKATARMNIILRGTTAAQGDAIRTAESFANQLKKLWSAVTDASSAIGGAFIEDIAALVSVAVKGVYAFRDFVSQNQDLARAIGLVTVSVVAAGVSLVALGIATQVTAGAFGSLMLAGKIAASGVAIAWASVGLVFTALTIKGRITAAIVSNAWKVAATAIGVAWRSLSGLISIVMQGAIGAVSAAAMAAPWIAAAAIIATVWFGLDTVIGTLAIAAAGAWSVSAGVVGTAWTAAAGILTPLAVAVGGAWTASAAFVGTAWTALTTVFAASGVAASAAALFASAAWAAHGALIAILAAEQTASATLVGLAWSAAGFISSVAWSGFVALLTAALAPASLMAGASLIVSGAWTIAAATASAAWAIAWGIITGPLLPFIVAGTAALAVVTSLVAAAGYLAIKGADFGAAWGIASKVLGRFVSIINTTFDAIKTALGSGDYAGAAEVLWLGVQAAFWTGVAGAMDAFKWLFSEGWAATKRFFGNMLDLTWRTMKAIAQAIIDPVGSYKELQGVIADIATSTISFDVDAKATGAMAALAARRSELTLTDQRIKAEKEADRARKARLEEIESINKRIAEGSITKEQGQQEMKKFDQKAAVDRQVFEGKIDEQQAMEIKIKIDTEGMTNQEVDSMVKSAKSEKEQNADKTYNDKVNSIELEILALEEGADAAERKRLADEGLTEAQINQIEALKDKKKQLEEIKALEEKQQTQRVDGIFNKANELRDAGVSPDEVFNRVMKQIDADQQSGKITKEQATAAKETARTNLDSDMERMRQEGRQLAEALRTPGEKLSAELKRISQLQDSGAIDEKTATRAEDRARKDFAEEQKRIEEQANQQTQTLDQEQKSVGPNATFSAAAASIIGNGGRFESESLKAQRATAENTAMIAKRTKERELARLG